MSINTLSRCGAALVLVALISGCSVISPVSSPSARQLTPTPPRVADQCKSSRRSCLYDGAYEPGERAYAEQEAKRLNLAESERLRRAFGN